MPSLKLNYPHQLGQAEAVSRMHHLLARVKEKYQDQVSDLKESWNDNSLTFSFSTYGFKISGDVASAYQAKCSSTAKFPSRP